MVRAIRNVALAGGCIVAAAYAYALLKLRRHERLDAAQMAAPGRHVRLQGRRIHLVEAGDGANPAIVLIHGLGGAAFDYRRIIGPLAEYRRVLALDLPGFGYSDPPASDCSSPRAHARLVLELLDQLGVRRATVAGQSWGGIIAMRLAIDAPDRVDRLILLAPAPLGRRVPKPLVRALAPLLWAALAHRPLRRRQMSTAVRDRSRLDGELWDELERRTRMRGRSRTLTRNVEGLASEPLPDPAAVGQPALILWGEDDRWQPPERGVELLSRMPNAEMRLIPDAGHLVVEEQPGLVAAAIRDFIGEPKVTTRRRPSARRRASRG